jgi:hypothetical protein
MAKAARPAPVNFSGDRLLDGGGTFNGPGNVNAPDFPSSPFLVSPPVNTRGTMFRINMGVTVAALVLTLCIMPVGFRTCGLLSSPSLLSSIGRIFTHVTSC